MTEERFEQMKRLEELQERYNSLCHAMQSGVAFKMNYSDSETSPKHLRVGVNSSLISNGALVHLLVKKGVITELEYYEELVEMMEAEVKSYEAWIAKNSGGQTKVTLG